MSATNPDTKLSFEPLFPEENERIAEMSALATSIVREHFDPLIGKAQNDYMLNMFQTPEAIGDQLQNGYRYFFVRDAAQNIVGFLAFYPRGEEMYLSKFYLRKEQRGKGYSRQMLQFVIDNTVQAGLSRIVLNVNRDNMAVQVYKRLGFEIIREEKNDIGHGFFMDDYVFAYTISER